MSFFVVHTLLFFFTCLVIFEVVFPFFLRVFEKFIVKKISRGSVFLTYDDAPGNKFQAELLNLLELHEVKATFFLNAQRAENNKGGCDELIEKGHELGFHAYAHYKAPFVTPWRFYRDLVKTRQVLRPWVEPNGYHRFPHGKFFMSSWFMSIFHGSIPIHWTVDSRDTFPPRPSVSKIIDKIARNGGGVVLMHSFDRPSDRDVEQYVLDITEALILYAKTERLAILKLSSISQKWHN